MTAMSAATNAPRTRPDARLLWGAVAGILVVIGMFAIVVEVPYLSSFVDWLINEVPPLSYLIVQYAVPIAFGALCGVMCERSGVTNIGIEGMILTSAFFAFLTGAYLHSVVGPLPAAVANGDTFQVWPGCDKVQATCSGKFANLARFRGQPYIPMAETAT